jgi:hypothetical protein
LPCAVVVADYYLKIMRLRKCFDLFENEQSLLKLKQ